MSTLPTCRHCKTQLDLVFADLGATPISNDYLTAKAVGGLEPFYPLKAFACRKCRLVQLQDFFRSDDLFRADYAYFSSISKTWLDHARRYAEDMRKRFALNEKSSVVEVASNDGYLLQYFKEAGIPVLGVEPSRSMAEFAIREKNIPTEITFFGRETALQLVAKGYAADLTAANNVFAHVPDVNDFVSGFREILKPNGVATFEFPHLLNLIKFNQFDTIYHEHFSYLSLLAAERIIKSGGLRVFDVEELNTHGGSLRIYACREAAAHHEQTNVSRIRHQEAEAGLHEDEIYEGFSVRIQATKYALLELLVGLKQQHKTIVGYGAPAKGNTLLNYCGIGPGFLDFTVDQSPAKQGLFLPGTRLPIKDPSAIAELKPDYVLILPWNIKDEIMHQMRHIREWGGKFIVPIPTPEIVS